eukprot:Tamp_23874.p1 GENE.Tamp_23874~~Tamp_23874.p1  ORF type:complete len:313 (-),score=46.84 Tamp_23874:77-982(-)
MAEEGATPAHVRNASGQTKGALVDTLCQVEVWEGLAPQLELRTLVLLACTHRDLRAILSEDSIWRASLRACVDVAHDLSVNAGEALTWRYVALQVLEGLVRLKHPAAQGVAVPRAHMLSEDSDQLAIKALKASTQDREEEDKKLVLTRSTCCTGKADDQKDCCCHNGAKPCYWSSMACDDPNTNDWISLRLNSMVCMVESITVLPYKAWWQVRVCTYAFPSPTHRLRPECTPCYIQACIDVKGEVAGSVHACACIKINTCECMTTYATKHVYVCAAPHALHACLSVCVPAHMNRFARTRSA